MTVLISLVTRPNKTDAELKGLVCSVTPRAVAAREPWYLNPVLLGSMVLAVTVILNAVYK
jgi:SSS family solute:Na+ symporter